MDWRTLARWNGIEPPYRIYPGQTIHLDGRAPPAVETDRKDGSPQVSTAREQPSRATRKPLPTAPGDPVWQWPVDGEVSRAYSGRHARRGIDIAGASGDDVRAAAPGRVVYSGAGLKGYGNLVIIKHDERYLSAYGFNRRLHVAQGDSVDAGQHIADVGHGPENRPLLYFEIRRDGEPVDPQRLLPGK